MSAKFSWTEGISLSVTQIVMLLFRPKLLVFYIKAYNLFVFIIALLYSRPSSIIKILSKLFNLILIALVPIQHLSYWFFSHIFVLLSSVYQMNCHSHLYFSLLIEWPWGVCNVRAISFLYGTSKNIAKNNWNHFSIKRANNFTVWRSSILMWSW